SSQFQIQSINSCVVTVFSPASLTLAFLWVSELFPSALCRSDNDALCVLPHALLRQVDPSHQLDRHHHLPSDVAAVAAVARNLVPLQGIDLPSSRDSAHPASLCTK